MEKITRPFRVCLTGAESTGKSALARELALRFSAACVPEYSRRYAAMVNRELSFVDVEPIARGQIDLIVLQERTALHPYLVILDTDLLSTVVYSRHHFGSCPKWIEEEARSRRADLYLLLDIDVPWIADGVRDSGDRRDVLHDEFVLAMREYDARYNLISGGWEERRRRSIEAIEAANPRSS